MIALDECRFRAGVPNPRKEHFPRDLHIVLGSRIGVKSCLLTFLNLLMRSAKSSRDRVTLELLSFCGLRRFEACALDTPGIDYRLPFREKERTKELGSLVLQSVMSGGPAWTSFELSRHSRRPQGDRIGYVCHDDQPRKVFRVRPCIVSPGSDLHS